MKLLLKVLIPVLVLVGSVFAAKTILENRPEPRTRPQFASVQAVEATKLSKSNYPVAIRSQGTVQPTKSSTIVAEVTGTVIELSDVFFVGGSFAKGDLLLQIDERDYTIALTQAQANLAQSTAALQEESARGKLAKAEWESMQTGRKASSFMLRLPQLAAARANRDAAKAQVDRAKLDLERTRFVAPYDGRVLEKSVDDGQFVARGARLGQIYANDSVDVRLPLSNRQLTFLDIPSSGNVPQSMLPAIELTALVGGVAQTWTGKVVRAEGVDTNTQQLNVIARVDNPYEPGKPPLRIGQYVEANIAGRLLEDVFVLPRAAVREGREVLLVNKDSELERREVMVVWSDEETAAVSEGLEAGAVLVITPLSTVTNGTPVRATVDGKAPPKRQGRPGGKPGGKPDGASGGNPDGQSGKEGQIQRGGEGSTNASDSQSSEAQRGQGKQGDGQRGEGRRPEGKRGDGARPEGKRPEAASAEGSAVKVGADATSAQDRDARAEAAAEALIKQAVENASSSSTPEFK